MVTVPIWIDPAAPDLLGTLSVGVALDSSVRRTDQAPHRQRHRVRLGRQGAGGHAGGRGRRRARRVAGRRPRWAGGARRRGIRSDRPAAVARRRRRRGCARPVGQCGRVAFAHRAPPPSSSVAPRARGHRAHRRACGDVAQLPGRADGDASASGPSRPRCATWRRPATSPARRRSPRARDGATKTRGVLAHTFNAMTASLGRFQREAAQRERLSSLGRLSTVIAHEIRNPLMIIKTALRSLRRIRHARLPGARRQWPTSTKRWSA